MLDEETKSLIRGYVKELLAEGKREQTLLEVVTIRATTRAAVFQGGWVDVEPGNYIVTSVEQPRIGGELVSLQRKDGKEYTSLVTRTARGQTAIGDAIWNG